MKITRFIVGKVFSSAADMKYFLWFGGVDVLLLYCDNIPGYSRFRIARFRWLMKRFIALERTYCYVNTPKLVSFLVDFGFDKDKISFKEIPWQRISVKRIKHPRFNVLFYLPTKRYSNLKFVNWMYGKQYLEALRFISQEVNWVVADGTLDMGTVYPTVDCYIKINKMPHNDMNKTGKECLYNDIPAKAFDVWRDDFDIYSIWEWIHEIKHRGLR